MLEKSPAARRAAKDMAMQVANSGHPRVRVGTDPWGQSALQLVQEDEDGEFWRSSDVSIDEMGDVWAFPPRGTSHLDTPLSRLPGAIRIGHLAVRVVALPWSGSLLGLESEAEDILLQQREAVTAAICVLEERIEELKKLL